MHQALPSFQNLTNRIDLHFDVYQAPPNYISQTKFWNFSPKWLGIEYRTCGLGFYVECIGPSFVKRHAKRASCIIAGEIFKYLRE